MLMIADPVSDASESETLRDIRAFWRKPDMDQKVRGILQRLRFKEPPAPAAAIADLRQALGVALPDEYVEILREMNGGEGPIGEAAYIMIYPIAGVILAHQKDLIHEEWPGVVVFATDGGDVAYAFDTRVPEMPIVETSFSDPTAFPLKAVGRTLREWFEYLIAYDPNA